MGNVVGSLCQVSCSQDDPLVAAASLPAGVALASSSSSAAPALSSTAVAPGVGGRLIARAAKVRDAHKAGERPDQPALWNVHSAAQAAAGSASQVVPPATRPAAKKRPLPPACRMQSPTRPPSGKERLFSATAAAAEKVVVVFALATVAVVVVALSVLSMVFVMGGVLCQRQYCFSRENQIC